MLVCKRFSLASIVFDMIVVRVFFSRSQKMLEIFNELETKAGHLIAFANEKTFDPLKKLVIAKVKKMVANYVLRGDDDIDARSRQNSEVPPGANQNRSPHHEDLHPPRVDSSLLMSGIGSQLGKSKNE